MLGVSLSGALLQAVLTRKLRERITGPGAFEVSSVFCPCDSYLKNRSLDHRTDSVRLRIVPDNVSKLTHLFLGQTLNQRHFRAGPAPTQSGCGLLC